MPTVNEPVKSNWGIQPLEDFLDSNTLNNHSSRLKVDPEEPVVKPDTDDGEN